MPPQVLLASWLVNRESYSDVIIVVVAFTSFLLMLTFCSMQDSIANYKVTFLNGIFGFMMAASMAFYSVHGKNSLSKVCLFFISIVLLYVKGIYYSFDNCLSGKGQFSRSVTCGQISELKSCKKQRLCSSKIK